MIAGPTNLEVVKTSTTYAIIQWEPPQMEIDRYHLSVAPSDGGDQGKQQIALPPSVSAQIDNLVAGVSYDVSLIAEKDGKQSAPVTIQVVPAESGETLNMVTTETKSKPVATDADRQKLRPGSKPVRKMPPRPEEKEVEKGRSNETRGVTPGHTKPLSKPYRNGTIRRPGILRPSQFNATRPGTGTRRVTHGGHPKQPGAYPGKPRWTTSQTDLPTSDSKPLLMTVTEDEEPQVERDSATSATDETRDPTTPAPHAAEVSGNTTGHPSGKKCHPKLIVGHHHLNGTIKAKVPVIRNITYATDEEKVNAILRELQKSSTDPTDTSSGEPGINLHISVFEVAPGFVPNADFRETPLASKTSAENDNGHISVTKLSLGLPLTSPTASKPSQPSDRGSEAAAERFPDSSEYAGSGKSPSSESSASTESSEYYSPSSSASEESLRTKTIVTSSESEPGRGDESDTTGSTPLKPSGFPKGKFTRRPGFGPFQNRTRPHLAPPLSPSRGPIRRPFPHRVPNGGPLNRRPQVQPGSDESTTDTTTHLKQRPGVTFRTRNDTRPGRPQPPVLPALAHATASTTAPPQPVNPTTPHPDDGENGHLDDKEESSPSGPFSSEEVPAGITEKPKTDRMSFPHGKMPPQRPRFPGGNGGPKSNVKPGVSWRKRNGTVIRPPTVPLTSPKSTPSPTSHRTAAPHAKTTASLDSVKPVDETLTARTGTEDVNLINGDTHPDDPKSRVPAVPGTATVSKSKPKPGVMIRRKNGTVFRLPPGHKPIKRPLGKTDITKATDAPIPAQPTLKSPDTIQGSTIDGKEGDQLSPVGVQKSSSDSVTLIWGAPEGKYKNFIVTRKRPTKGEDPDNPVAEENEKVKEREEEAQRGDGEDTAVTTDITGSSPKASLNNTFTKVLPGSARSFLFEGLRPQTQYVLSVFGKGPGHRSKTHSVTVNTGPEPPTNLLFSGITDTTVSVSWTKPRSPVTGFKVTYTHTLEGEPVSVSMGAGDSTIDLSQLSPGSSYEVNVISLLNLDESDPLKGTVHTLPDPPTDLHAINITDTKALLLWRPALAPVDNYVIVYGSEKGPDVTISVSGNAAAQQLTGLEASTDYSVTITSHLGNRKSNGATTAFTTTGGSGRGGDGPKDLAASQITPRSAMLTWKPPSAKVSGYKLQYAIEGQAFQDAFVGPDLSKHRLVRLRPSAKYIVRLQAEIGGVYTEAITTDFTTGYLRFPFPSDCSQELLNGVHESGLAEIFPHGQDSAPVTVYCDMETDGGGWTVFQRRKNGQVEFYRGWKEYRDGFGDPSEEFWMGNELIHNITRMIPMSLRVDMRAEGESVFAKYSSFSVGSATRKPKYLLRVSGYTGNAGDSMTYHNERGFSTRDRDTSDIRVCAMSYRGGWWYRNCHEANLNGLYATSKNHQGVIWTTWKGKEYSIPFVEMKMRPTSFRPPSQG